MFKELRALWKDGSIMGDVISLLGEMVSSASYVYGRAWEACTGNAVSSTTEDNIREQDKAVNRGERKARRMLVEHLTLNPGQDVSGCLAVMVMAKDIERIGDHARNIYGVGARMTGSIENYRLFKPLDGVQKQIGGHFPKLERAILNSDESLAHEILAGYQEIKKEVKDAQSALFETDLSGAEAVNTTLLTRFLMRINAHVGNTASGIVFPLENIDFVSRGLRQEDER
jgi:phosphate uptake regulator